MSFRCTNHLWCRRSAHIWMFSVSRLEPGVLLFEFFYVFFQSTSLLISLVSVTVFFDWLASKSCTWQEKKENAALKPGSRPAHVACRKRFGALPFLVWGCGMSGMPAWTPLKRFRSERVQQRSSHLSWASSHCPIPPPSFLPFLSDSTPSFCRNMQAW